LAILPWDASWHSLALGGWDAPALFPWLPATPLLLHVCANLSWDVPALFILHTLALLHGHCLAVFPRNLSWHIVALLCGDVAALLPWNRVALLLRHVRAHLLGHIVALLTGNLTTGRCLSSSVSPAGSSGSSTSTPISWLGCLANLLVYCVADLLIDGVADRLVDSVAHLLVHCAALLLVDSLALLLVDCVVDSVAFSLLGG